MKRVKLNESQLRRLVTEMLNSQAPLGDQGNQGGAQANQGQKRSANNPQSSQADEEYDGVHIAGLVRELVKKNRNLALGFLRKFGYDDKLKGEEHIDNVDEMYQILNHSYGQARAAAEREADKIISAHADGELAGIYESGDEEIKKTVQYQYIGYALYEVTLSLPEDVRKRIIYGKHNPGKNERQVRGANALAMFTSKHGGGKGRLA